MPIPAGDDGLYITLDELKDGRRITKDDDDVALTRAITAACRQIDRKTGRRFYLDATATTRIFGVTGRLTPNGVLLVDDIGSDDGLVVESGSASAWTATTAYESGPENALTLGWPVTELAATPGAYWAGPQVRVTARWGWPEVPDDISMAALLLANRLYLRKDSPEGIAGGGEWGAIRLSRWDPDVEVLVSPFILPGFA